MSALCPQCGQEIGNQSAICPFCGFRVKEEKCVICNQAIKTNTPLVIAYSSADGEERHCCENCEKQLATLQECKDPYEVRKALDSISPYIEKMQDDETKKYLTDTCLSEAKVYLSNAEVKENVHQTVSSMFSNIGGKIKGLAKWSCWMGIIASLIVGIIANKLHFGVRLTLIVVGSLISWLSSLALYGFGELIDEVKKNNRLLEQLREGK